MLTTLITRSLVRGVGIAATLAAGLLALSPGLAFAQNGTWNVDASGDWSLNTNWNPAAVPGNAAGDVIGLTNNITAARTVTIDTTSRTVGALNIGDSNNTHAFTLAASGGAGLTFNNGGSGVALTELGTIQDTVSTPVTLADNLTVNVGGQLSISGPISESGGSRSLTKSGLGYLTLGGNNTYAGDTTVTGRLTVAANNALGTTDGATIVSTGGQVRINNLVTVSGERLTLSGTGESTSEGALRIASGTATWGGIVTLAANATVLAGGGNVLKIGPGSGTAINLQGNTLDYTGAGGHEVLGGVFGTGGIAKRGSGPLTLSGSGSYSGATTIALGKIVANATSALGTSPVTTAGGSLELQGGFDVGGGLLTLNGESLTNVSGNNTYSGPVTAVTSSRIFVTSGTMTLSNTITASSSPITFSGNGVTLISGNLGAGLTSLDINAKASDVPTVIVAGSNPDFTGTVDVQVGSLQLGNGGTTGALPTNKAITVGGANANARFIVKQSDTVTQGTDFFSGPLTGKGGFTQAGSGTTVLNAANVYLGTTNVDAGTLIINGNQAGATGAVTVANGATIGGSGTIGGAVIVNGILSPGNSPGLLTVGSLDLRAGSTTLMQIIGAGNLAGTAGTAYDKLVISTAGGLGYGGTLDLDFANTTTFADGTTFDLFGFTGSTLGRFGSVSSTGSGSYGGLTFSGLDGVWTALFGSQQLTFSELTGQLRFTTNSVPEIDPATGSSALSLIAGVVALIEQRRRRAKVVA